MIISCIIFHLSSQGIWELSEKYRNKMNRTKVCFGEVDSDVAETKNVILRVISTYSRYFHCYMITYNIYKIALISVLL